MSDNKRLVAEYARKLKRRHEESKWSRFRDRIAVWIANWALVNIATDEYQFELFWLYRVADEAMHEVTS